jgi:hypothetical protein
VLLRGVGQALLARGGFICHARSTLNKALLDRGLTLNASGTLKRKGGLRVAQGSSPGPSGSGTHKPRQKRSKQKGRVDEF